MKIEGWRARFVVELGYHLIQLLVRTLRFEIEDRGGIVLAARASPFIFPVWHNRLLLLPAIFRRFLAERNAAALISASRDGDMLAAFVERYGYGTIRGSSSRRGASAMLRLTEVFESGTHIVITPDGPRGPVYEMGRGVIFLAQKTNADVVPASVEFSRSWRLRSWDRFMIPRPFATVRVILGSRMRIADTADDEEFEAERLRLQNAVMELVEER